MAVGPFTPGFVAEREEVLALADVGVALLMFSIGLQFSLGELRSVGARILGGTPLQVALTMAIGTGTGLLMGWELAEALFIGGAVAVCSTVVLAKVAGEGTLHSTSYGRAALGVSIVQDLVTVVLVVALTALGSPDEPSLFGDRGERRDRARLRRASCSSLARACCPDCWASSRGCARESCS